MTQRMAQGDALIAHSQICVDNFPKSFQKQEGITALPRLGVYRPGQGRVVVLDIPYSRLKYLRKVWAWVCMWVAWVLNTPLRGAQHAAGALVVAHHAARVPNSNAHPSPLKDRLLAVDPPPLPSTHTLAHTQHTHMPPSPTHTTVQNMSLVLEHKDQLLAVDPNGFVVTRGPMASKEELEKVMLGGRRRDCNDGAGGL